MVTRPAMVLPVLHLPICTTPARLYHVIWFVCHPTRHPIHQRHASVSTLASGNPVLGYLSGGALVGPYALGIVSECKWPPP